MGLCRFMSILWVLQGQREAPEGAKYPSGERKEAPRPDGSIQNFYSVESPHYEPYLEVRQLDTISNNAIDLSPGLLSILLFDRTTRGNIIWATNNYESLGPDYYAEKQILPEQVSGSNIIQPRVAKSLTAQASRTRNKAEVFTPSWVCNAQNNLVDEAWFGRKNVFNTVDGHNWCIP